SVSSLTRRPARSTLSPYTTLFRSRCCPCAMLEPTARPKSSWASSTGQSHQLRQAGGRRPSRWFHRLQQRCGQEIQRKRLTTPLRSEEHTSELQSRFDLVCRLLLEK